MRVLVTGGAGYIGSHTVALLHGRGDQVTVLDTLERGHPVAVGEVPLVVGDVGDRALVRDLLVDHRIEAVVHFAARKSVTESLADPGAYFATNTLGSLALLRAMVDAGVNKLVFSSTCAVYGTPSELPVTEVSPLSPDNPYGESKLLVERMLPWFEAASGLRTICLRYFNAAGAAADGSNGEDWQHAENLIPVVMRTALGLGPAVEINGSDYPTPDGTAIRDYVHVLDLADIHARALDHMAEGGLSATVNVGTGAGASVLQVIEATRAASGRTIETRSAPRRPGDPAVIWADNQLARELLGWSPRFGLADIVASAWRWHSTHPEGHGPLSGSSTGAVA